VRVVWWLSRHLCLVVDPRVLQDVTVLTRVASHHGSLVDTCSDTEDADVCKYTSVSDCLVTNLKKGVLVGSGFRLVFNLSGALLRGKLMKNPMLLFDSVLNYGAFIASMSASFNTFMFLARTSVRRTLFHRYKALVGGMTAGLSLMFIPAESRGTFALFTFVRAFEIQGTPTARLYGFADCRHRPPPPPLPTSDLSALNPAIPPLCPAVKLLARRKLIPVVDNADTCLMSAASAYVIWAAINVPHCVDPSYMKFLYRHWQLGKGGSQSGAGASYVPE
jgi:hypothetical protein